MWDGLAVPVPSSYDEGTFFFGHSHFGMPFTLSRSLCMKLKELISRARTCRRFKGDHRLSSDTLADLVDHARLSASARNHQVLRFITLSDRDISGLAKPEETFDELQGATISWKNDDGLLRDVVLPWCAHFNQAAGNDIQLEIDLQATFKGLDTGSVGIALTGEEPCQYPDEIG